MKLSEAIKQGARIRPQIHGDFFALTTVDNYCVGSCALGAAYEIITGEINVTVDDRDDMVGFFRQHTDADLNAQQPYPESPVGTHSSIYSIIVALNDRAKWSREQIAEWLDTLGL